MDYYNNLESFDISKAVEQYRGKALEELFPNHQVIKNEMGKFMDITWKEENFPNGLKLKNTRKKLLQNLKTVYYVGEKIERQLMRRGNKTLFDLSFHRRYSNSANEIIDLIKLKDFRTLSFNKYIYDMDVLFCFDIPELLFIDIETLGVYDSPMILIGLGFFKNNTFEIHQYFARDLEEEIAICEYLKNEVFPKFKCFITYNGKSFDIPYIANRFLYYFDENPMISGDDTPYKESNTIYHHVDLYHNCRRKYKGEFYSYTLTNMEEQLLNWERHNELPGSLVGFCYKSYLKDPERYIGLIKECIDHNYYDVYSMPLLLKNLLEKE